MTIRAFSLLMPVKVIAPIAAATIWANKQGPSKPYDLEGARLITGLLSPDVVSNVQFDEADHDFGKRTAMWTKR